MRQRTGCHITGVGIFRLESLSDEEDVESWFSDFIKEPKMATFNNILEKKIKAALRAAKIAAKKAAKEARAASLKKAQNKREALAAASAKNAAKLLKTVVAGFESLFQNATKVAWIAVHNGIFHADDVVAVALFKALGYHVVVDRLPHQTPAKELEKYDYVLDIGRKYDGVKYFDHHHDKDLEASNMLVFKYFIEKGLVSERQAAALQEFMQIVSDQDRGVGDKRPADSIIGLIQNLNANNIYGEEQDEAFAQAVDIVAGHIGRILKNAAEKDESLNILKSSKRVADGILEMPGFVKFWNELIFEIPEFNDIDLVIWYDAVQNKWKAQQVPDALGSFGRRGRKLTHVNPLPEDIEFIHVGEFFAVASSKEALLDYISKYAV